MNTGTTDDCFRKLQASKIKLKRQRDSWKSCAIELYDELVDAKVCASAYRDIVERSRKWSNRAEVDHILAEADKLEGK